MISRLAREIPRLDRYPVLVRGQDIRSTFSLIQRVNLSALPGKLFECRIQLERIAGCLLDQATKYEININSTDRVVYRERTNLAT